MRFKILMFVAFGLPLVLARRLEFSPKLPHDPNSSRFCTWWFDNDAEHALPCKSVPESQGCTMQDFLRWNPSITPDCGNFLVGYSYCVEAYNEPGTSSSTTTTSTKSSSTSTTSTTTSTSTSTTSTSVSSTTTTSPTTTTSTTSSSTTTSAGNGVATPTPTQPGIVSNCNKFYFVQSGETCQGIADKNGISLQDFASWNGASNPAKCGVWANVYACVNVIGRQPSTTKPDNGIQTPSPVQPDIVDTCSKFHYVQKSQNCDDVAKANGISTKDLASWNRKVGGGCAGLWADTYACVGVIDMYDFQKANLAGWNVIDGAFSADSQALVASNVPAGKAYVSAEMNDFIMQSDVIISSGSGNAGLIFRASNIGKGADAYCGYYVGITSQNGGAIILGRANNDWNQLASVPASIQPGKSYRLHVEAVGDGITISLNQRSNKVISVRDGTFRSGSCGVRVYSTGATYDNIGIYSAVYDPFDVNMAGWSIADGGFDARTGVMQAPRVDSGKATLNTIFSDFTFDVDVSINSGGDGNVGVLFRASNVGSGPDSYQGYYVGIEPGRLTLGKANFGWTLIKSVAANIGADTNHHIRILAYKTTLAVWVDDMATAKIAAVDDSHSSGVVGARVYRAGGKYDNFEVVHGIAV